MGPDTTRGGALPVILALVLGFVLVGAGVWWVRQDFRTRFETPLKELRQPVDSLQALEQRSLRDAGLADSLRAVIATQVGARLAQRQQERVREDSLGRAEARRAPADSLVKPPRTLAPLAERDLEVLAASLEHLPPQAAGRVLEKLGPREAARVLEKVKGGVRRLPQGPPTSGPDSLDTARPEPQASHRQG